MSFKVDLHCHTTASPDGGLTESDIAGVLSSGKLDRIAVTDHNTIDEAVRLHSIHGDAIIVGEEIMTTDGEIIGLYLSEVVPKGLSPQETVQRIKDQKGLVYIPHPFEKVRSGISEAGLESIRTQVDLIEVLNGRSFSRKAQRQAREWSLRHNIPGIASSDAHGRIGWGRVYTIFSTTPTHATVVTLAHHGKLYGMSNGYYSYLYPKMNKIRKIFLKA